MIVKYFLQYGFQIIALHFYFLVNRDRQNIVIVNKSEFFFWWISTLFDLYEFEECTFWGVGGNVRVKTITQKRNEVVRWNSVSKIVKLYQHLYQNVNRMPAFLSVGLCAKCISQKRNEIEGGNLKYGPYTKIVELSGTQVLFNLLSGLWGYLWEKA